MQLRHKQSGSKAKQRLVECEGTVSRGNVTKPEHVINKSRPQTDIARSCLAENTASCSEISRTGPTFGRQSMMSYCSSEWRFPTNYRTWLCGSCYVSRVRRPQPRHSESLRLHPQQTLLCSTNHFQWVTKLFAPACIPKKNTSWHQFNFLAATDLTWTWRQQICSLSPRWTLSVRLFQL